MSELEGFGERLKSIIVDMRYTINSFSKEIGENRSQKLLSTVKGQNNVGVTFLMDISRRFPEINFDYLITGRGKPFKTETEHSEITDRKHYPETNINPDSLSLYKQLYEQCRELQAAKDELIHIQKKQINLLEKK